MTTASWSTRLRHDSDAMFREWGLEFNTKLAAVGLVQTADTGQVNWTTVTRAGANSDAGYEIWRFNDTMQATAPIFLRFDYGTGGATTAPRIRVTVGTGSNGSGTINGLVATLATISSGAVAQTTDSLRNSYMCEKDGNFGLSWKQASGSGVEGLFSICRTMDASGVATATGALIVAAATGASISAQSLRFASTATAYTQQTTIATMQLCLWPMARTTSLVGADLQVALAFTITPRIEPVLGVCGCLHSEFVTGNTFTATLIGSTPRTYLALNNTSQLMDANQQLKPAILWE